MNFSLSNIFKGDRGIWIIIFFLSMYSMWSVYSAAGQLAFLKANGNTTYFLFRQGFMICLSVFFIILLSNIPHKYFSKISIYLYYLSIFLLVFTLFFGLDVNDARRWLLLPGGITFQTSDFAKIALIMYLSRTLAINETKITSFFSCLKQIFFPIALTAGLILPANLSTAVLIFIVSFLLLFFSNLKIKYIFGMIGICILLGGMFLGIVVTNKDVGRFATWNNRIESFLNKDNSEENIQEKHAKIAVATGKLVGKGPGNSNQRNILPHPYSDYIFAIIVEELGLVFGAIPILFLYLFLFARVRIIVKNVSKNYGAYLVSGLASLIIVQALSNMAVTTNIIPVTGQPLPFVSYGGTSILFIGIAFGVILSVSNDNKKAEKQKLAQDSTTEINNNEDIENTEIEQTN